MDATSNLIWEQLEPTAKIDAVKVTDALEKIRYLTQIGGSEEVDLECTIGDVLSTISDDPDGCFFDYYRLSNGGFYMVPYGSTSYRIRLGAEYFNGAVSAKTAGIIATAVACRELSLDPFGSRFALAYQLLSEFISQHPDAQTIRVALGELVGVDF